MSKLAFFLCLLIGAVFITSSEAGVIENVSKRIQEAKDTLVNLIKQAIEGFQKQVTKIKERALQNAEALRKKALEIIQQVYDRVNKAVQNTLHQIDEKIKQLTAKADGVDVTECTQMANELHNTALAIVANSSACVTDKIEQGTGYVESITRTTEEVYHNLTQIGHQAQDCTKNINGVETSVKALACLGVATKDAVVTATKKIPSVLLDLTKLSFHIGTLVPSLTICSATTSIATFLEQSRDVIASVEQCVQHKISAHSTVPSTTNSPVPSTTTFLSSTTKPALIPTLIPHNL